MHAKIDKDDDDGLQESGGSRKSFGIAFQC
jgi:hypothetical protein